MPATETIAVTVISGFLGAGKTTWLNRRIREGLPANSVIIVNDFGRVNIDAKLIEYSDERILKLANGCICCSLGGTLAEQLLEVKALNPSRILIEASGVAEPAKIIDIARLSPFLKPQGIDCLVDASQLARRRNDPYTHEIWQAQIASASRLWINRLPADKSQADSAIKTLRQLNPTAKLHIDYSKPQPLAKAQAIQGLQTGRMNSFTLSLSSAVDAPALATILGDYSDVLLRAKGQIYCRDTEPMQVLQMAGQRINWSDAKRTMPPTLVCIGIGGQRFEALKQSLRDELSL